MAVWENDNMIYIYIYVIWEKERFVREKNMDSQLDSAILWRSVFGIFGDMMINAWTD